jgi:hypothetical protein
VYFSFAESLMPGNKAHAMRLPAATAMVSASG